MIPITMDLINAWNELHTQNLNDQEILEELMARGFNDIEINYVKSSLHKDVVSDVITDVKIQELGKHNPTG